MKKNIFIVALAVALTLIVSTLLVSCAEKVDYSVTVLSPDEKPVKDVTVSWLNGSNVAGSAKTDGNGKASVSIPSGTYKIVLDGIAEGWEFTQVSVTPNTRNITLELSVKQITYSVTVKDKTGASANGVTVNWLNENGIAGSAKTDANGKAEKSLPYGDYFVTLDNLPQGNITDDDITVNGSSPSAEIKLIDGVPVSYSVTVRSEGGLLFKQQDVVVKKGSAVRASGKTDENGVFTFSLAALTYSVSAASIPEGYSFEPVSVTADSRTAELVLYSEILYTAPAADKVYKIGDIIHNYSFTTPYVMKGSKEVWSKSLADLLIDEHKEAIIINNWGTNCSFCVGEMPDMEAAYQKYKDKIEIIAVSNYVPADNDAVINNWYASYGYTFPMMMDKNNFRTKFNIQGWPTTVIIDRYGAIARIESGAVASLAAWERMIEKYIGDDYVQTFVPGTDKSDSINAEMSRPDVTVPDNHYENLANAINVTDTFPQGASVTWRGMDYEFAWPFFYGNESTERFKLPALNGGENVMYSTNTRRANSMSAIYADIKVPVGYVFAFDYYSDTESGDIMHFIWDGKIVNQITGETNGWKTCYLYADLTDEVHELTMSYMKYDDGKDLNYDNVFIANVRFEPISVLKDDGEEVNMFRGAAYGELHQGDTSFPHYATVDKDENGYYYVNLSSLLNSEVAGNDSQPMLFASLMNVTHWMPTASILQLFNAVKEDGSGEYLFDCVMIKDGQEYDYRQDFMKYFSAANSSDIRGYVPVNDELKQMLSAFMKTVSGNQHEDEWLEVCYFYSHYGQGTPIGNPILGVLDQTAVPVEAGQKITADLTRNMFPYPSMKYTFTPTQSAVYKFESFIKDSDKSKYSAQISLYDEKDDLDYSGDTRITLGGKNEQNFELYRYLEAGHKYYFEVSFLMQERGYLELSVTNVGQTATEIMRCSDDLYDMVLDENGKFSGEITLSHAVDYELGGDGFYHVKNKDGSLGSVIYLSTKYADTTALGTIPLTRLVDYFVDDPGKFDSSGRKEKLDYKMFNFRYYIQYINTTDYEGNEIVSYNPNVDITASPEFSAEIYKDYTEIMKQIIADADENGLVPVTKEIADIMLLFIELRVNPSYDGVVEKPMDNEWLRFCWYYRHHGESENQQ